MKNLLLTTCLLCVYILSSAQDYLDGKVRDAIGVEQNVFYDRTQYAITNTVYQTIYKVVDKNKSLLYTVTLTHDQSKSSLTIATKVSGADARGEVVRYSKNESGLIYTNTGNTDTAFRLPGACTYVFSFADVSRDYPILHILRAQDGKQLQLDPLSKLRIRKHNELVQALFPQVTQLPKPKQDAPAKNIQHKEDINVPQKPALADVKQPEIPAIGVKQNNTSNRVNDLQKQEVNKMAEMQRINDSIVKADDAAVQGHLKNVNSFNEYMVHMRDSLYKKNTFYNDYIAFIRSRVDRDMESAFKDVRIYKDESRYEGEKKAGKPHGDGLLVDRGSIYDGQFENGVFLKGKAIVRDETGEYNGEFSNNQFNGTGWLKYKGGSYLLGAFKNGSLVDGVCLCKDKGGEIFFGRYKNNERTGYGELRNGRGDLYYGEFVNGHLIKGYSKEVDQFGYATYSKIENGAKVSVDPMQVKEFFDMTVLADPSRNSKPEKSSVE
jgi:hypothetical protein